MTPAPAGREKTKKNIMITLEKPAGHTSEYNFKYRV